MLPFFSERFGNPSSRHGLGVSAQAAVDEARQVLATAVACAPSGVVFTSGGTEADVLALRGAVGSRRERGVVVSAVEHAAVLATGRALERAGHRLTVVPVDRQGRVDADAFVAAVDDNTGVAALMAVSNELGTLQPVAEVSRRVKEKAPRALFHVDAVPAFARLGVSFRTWPHVDTIAVSAHKIYGPKGTGALFVRETGRLEPVLTGGGQEAGLRSGTHNVAGAVGFAAAYGVADWRRVQDFAHYSSLDRSLIEQLEEKLPEIEVNGPRVSLEAPAEATAAGAPLRVPYIVNLRVPDAPAEPLLNGLEGEGFLVSSGSACHSKSGSISHVLAAIGLSEADGGSLRISIGRSTTEADVARFVEVLFALVPRLRRAVARRA